MPTDPVFEFIGVVSLFVLVLFIFWENTADCLVPAFQTYFWMDRRNDAAASLVALKRRPGAPVALRKQPVYHRVDVVTWLPITTQVNMTTKQLIAHRQALHHIKHNNVEPRFTRMPRSTKPTTQRATTTWMKRRKTKRGQRHSLNCKLGDACATCRNK